MRHPTPPIRILVLNGRSDLGGGPKIAYRLLQELDKTRFQILVACPDEPPYFEKISRIPGVEILPLDLRRLRISNLWHLIQTVRAHEIQCVHSHGRAAGIWSRALKLFQPQLQVIHHYHGLHYRKHGPWVRVVSVQIERLLSRLTTRVVHVSESEEQEAQRLRLSSHSKRIVIRNGIETWTGPGLSRTDARRKLGLRTDRPLCVVVARYSYPKNLYGSFEVIARLQESGMDVGLVVVGGADDISREEIETQCEHLGVTEHVHLVGPQEDVELYLRAADVYLSTSHWEGLPTSVLEAMSIGLPVVASRVVGNETALTPETGLLVEPGDLEGFVQSIRRLIADPKLRARLGEAGKKRVQRDFSIRRMVEAHEKLYREVVSGSQ